jgi:hypothetical protein
MRAHQIENGVVVNTIEVESLDFMQGLVDGENGGAIGDRYENGQFVKPEPVVDPLAYQAQRAAEYPPMTDYIDGIVKGDQAQMQTYIDACLAVKAKYPKP